MILSRHDAIAELDLKYAQIRWVTWKYYALRGESLFCSYSPSATIPSRTVLCRDFAREKPRGICSILRPTSAPWNTASSKIRSLERLCVPRTSSALISRRNRLTSAHHDRAAGFRTGRLGL